MRGQLGLLATATLATSAWACQREENIFKRHTHRKPLARRQDGQQWPPVLTDHETVIVNSFDNVTIDQWADYYGHEVKLAGLGKGAAEWTRDRFSENGFEAELNEYHVYLSYPIHAALHVTYANGTTNEVNLVEDVLEEDDVTGREDNTPTFHGYSASGNVTAEYVYVGLGTFDDFERLEELGVDLEGKIALIRYGSIFRGLKVKNAEDHGMVGAIIFSDPGDDANVTVAKGVAAYPDGPARNPSSVQKGSVLFLSTHPGDPTTPGYPSLEGAPRAEISDVTPQIPSIPISYASAQPLLQALDGYGKTATEVNRTQRSWRGALNATYSTGPAPGVKLSLDNQMEGKITPIWNVIGRLNGTNSDETIVVGNHRDSWSVGGVGDPNSGSAALVEFTKALNALVKTGWKPRRNIVIASWDAEEYGLLGSTEWVEENVNTLTETAVAYLNIDVAVSGPRPDVACTPELHTISTEVMKKIVHPNFGGFNRSLYEAWREASGGTVGVLGSGSDYTAFVHRGISSLDVGSSGSASRGDPIWHYHSNYDSYYWMSTFGDPGFHVHSAMGQYLALLTLHLADDEVLPFDLPNYAQELRAYHEDLVEFAAEEGASLDFAELADAIDVFERRASEVKTLELLAVSSGDEELIRTVNHKYRDFQRGFISQGGLPGREFYKHVAFAPGLDTGYAAVTFPGITEGVQYGNVSAAQEWVSRTAKGILVAADIIKT